MVGASLFLPYFTLQPMKMEPIEGSETSANMNQTPGNYPKGNLLQLFFKFSVSFAIMFNRFYRFSSMLTHFI